MITMIKKTRSVCIRQNYKSICVRANEQAIAYTCETYREHRLSTLNGLQIDGLATNIHVIAITEPAAAVAAATVTSATYLIKIFDF